MRLLIILQNHFNVRTTLTYFEKPKEFFFNLQESEQVGFFFSSSLENLEKEEEVWVEGEESFPLHTALRQGAIISEMNQMKQKF